MRGYLQNYELNWSKTKRSNYFVKPLIIKVIKFKSKALLTKLSISKIIKSSDFDTFNTIVQFVLSSFVTLTFVLFLIESSISKYVHCAGAPHLSIFVIIGHILHIWQTLYIRPELVYYLQYINKTLNVRYIRNSFSELSRSSIY